MTDKPVKPRLLPSGCLLCPACRNRCVTPRAKHPVTGRVEKMVLHKGTAPCPHCRVEHQMDEVARWHNAVWDAGDPAYAPGPLFDPVAPPPRIRIWTWRKAIAAIHYLAPLVAGLRSAICRVSHLRLVARKAARPSRVSADDLGDAKGEADALGEEIEAAGVLLHGGPLRGTVLFPSFIHHSGSRPRGLYLIWRGSRSDIETYVMADQLRQGNDLAACERPLPKAWRDMTPEVIHPRRVRSWPRLFWQRVQSSYCGNDLECRACGGRGLAGRRAVCPACRGSGLLVRRRKPADPVEIEAAEVAWTCVTNRQLVWPRPWVWEIPLLFIRGARDLYLSTDDVLALMTCGRLALRPSTWGPIRRHASRGPTAWRCPGNGSRRSS